MNIINILLTTYYLLLTTYNLLLTTYHLLHTTYYIPEISAHDTICQPMTWVMQHSSESETVRYNFFVTHSYSLILHSLTHSLAHSVTHWPTSYERQADELRT